MCVCVCVCVGPEVNTYRTEVQKYDCKAHTFDTIGLRLIGFSLSVWIFSVRNSVLEVILQGTCGDSYQLNMATRLEQWSKHEVRIVMRFFDESNMSAEKYVVRRSPR